MGPEGRMVRVPDMVGSTQAAVLAAFRENDLIADISEHEHNTPAGTVYFIAHAGEQIQAGSTIAIQVSTGPAATPEPTPEPRFTVTVSGGSGGGNFEAGTTIQISASPPAGQQFREWVISPVVTFTSGSETSPTATFTMPESAVTATAVFDPIPTPSPPPDPTPPPDPDPDPETPEG